MPEVIHEEALQNVSEVNIQQQTQNEFVGKLIQEAKTAQRDRQPWLDKVQRNYKKRFGIRPSKRNFPWPNAANHHIYLSDEKIRRMKPNYLNLAFEGDPIVRFTPVGNTPPEVATNAEIFMDWKLKYHMSQVPGFNYLESLALIVDDMTGHYGYGIAKVIWHNESNHRTAVIDLDKIPFEVKQIVENPLVTDEELKALLTLLLDFDQEDQFDKKQITGLIKQFREGKRVLKYKERYSVYKGSRVLHIQPENLTVPRDTTHIQNSRWIKHDMWFSYQELAVGQRDGKYENVDKIKDIKPKANREFYSTIEVTKESREGNFTSSTESDLIKVSEIYTYYDIDGDGVGEKVVITLVEDSGDSEPIILRFIEFPYDHGKWPFVKFNNELTDERWYSPRSYAEMLDHYQTIATNTENNKLDRMTIENSLPIKARLNSTSADNVRWIPGQFLWVKRSDDIDVMNIPNNSIAYDQEQEKILRRAESYIGQPDLMIGAMENPAERRTAYEVGEAVSHGKQIFSLDGRLFRSSLADLYDQIYELEMQYGDEEVYVRSTGEEKNTTKEGLQIPSFVRLSKSDLRGNMVVVPNGEFTLLSRVADQQTTLRLLELGQQDRSGAVNQRELWKEAFRLLKPQLAKRALNTEAEYQQIQQMQMQQAQLEFQQKMAVAGRTS